jgi:hypothetical protein
MQRARLFLAVVVSLAGLSYFVATTRPFPVVELIAAFVLAALAVILSIRRPAGASRVAKHLVWVNAIGGLLWAMAFAPDMFAGAWLAGVFAYGLVVSLQRVLRQPARMNHG